MKNYFFIFCLIPCLSLISNQYHDNFFEPDSFEDCEVFEGMDNNIESYSINSDDSTLLQNNGTINLIFSGAFDPVGPILRANLISAAGSFVSKDLRPRLLQNNSLNFIAVDPGVYSLDFGTIESNKNIVFIYDALNRKLCCTLSYAGKNFLIENGVIIPSPISLPIFNILNIGNIDNENKRIRITFSLSEGDLIITSIKNANYKKI